MKNAVQFWIITPLMFGLIISNIVVCLMKRREYKAMKADHKELIKQTKLLITIKNIKEDRIDKGGEEKVKN